MYVCGLGSEMNRRAEGGRHTGPGGHFMKHQAQKGERETLRVSVKNRELEFNKRPTRLHSSTCDAEHNLACVILVSIYVTWRW